MENSWDIRKKFKNFEHKIEKHFSIFQTFFNFVYFSPVAKEVVIVLDASGSMKGFRQVLAVLTIRTIITTLSDRDYFNVIHFNDKTG